MVSVSKGRVADNLTPQRDGNKEQRRALQAVAAAVIAQKPPNRDDESYLLNAAQIAASIASTDMYLVAGSIPEVSSTFIFTYKDRISPCDALFPKPEGLEFLVKAFQKAV